MWRMDLAEARSRWNAFVQLPFPRGWAGVEVNERPLALTDSEVAGCLDTFFGGSERRRPTLDHERRQILVSLLPELDDVVAALEGEPRDYFVELRELARFVIEGTRA